MLGRARDQVAGGRHQADAEARPPARRARPRARRAAAGIPASASSRRSVLMPAASAPTIRPPLEPHDAVGARGELGAVRDQQHRAPGAQPLDRLADELGARRVEVRGRLVEDHERRVAQERARERDPLPLAGRERPPALADDRLVPVGQRGDEARRRRPARRRPARARRSRRDRRAGCCRRPCRGRASAAAAPRRRCARHAAASHAGEVDARRPSRGRRVGSQRRSRSEATVLLPPPLAPTSATVSPGLELEVDGLEHGDSAGPGRRTTTRLEPDRRVARARRSARRRR